MNTHIFSVFPACGKTYLYSHQKDYGLKILDSDSSQFSWLKVLDEQHECKNRGKKNYKEKFIKVRNPDFPRNYIEHIKANIGKYDYIFVSSHRIVREALAQEGIKFAVVYPDRKCKAEWIGRCYIREMNSENGCSTALMYENFDGWISELEETGTSHGALVLSNGEYLSTFFEGF